MAEYKANPPELVATGAKINIPKPEIKPKQFTYCANKSMSVEFEKTSFGIIVSGCIWDGLTKTSIKEYLCEAVDKFWEVCKDE